MKYSTARAIAHSRIYLGEVLLNDEWFPGNHEPLISATAFAAAHRGAPPWHRRSRHVLAGRVRCGLCGRVATIRYGREGRALYRCRHRGAGCSQPSRSAVGLIHAVLLGLRLVAEDEELQEAIRRELKNAVGSGAGEPRRGRGKTLGIQDLAERRRKLLALYYADKLSAELFAEEEARLSGQIEAVRREQEERRFERSRLSDLAAEFEEVARILREMDVERLWAEATDLERRVLVEELLESVAMYPDHLEVTVSGAPRLNVTLEEVGLTGGWQFRGVGGPKRSRTLGWDFAHVAIDDHSRLAYAEQLPDELATTAAAFLERALAFFAAHGIAVTRVMTDNGSPYVSGAFAGVLAERGIRHLRTRPYTPRTNGKAEAMVKVLINSWAYARPYESSAQRAEALSTFIDFYNLERPHGGLNGTRPIDRIRQ